MMRAGKLSETATTAPRGARAFVRDTLSGSDGATIDDATLLVSEITTASMAVSGVAAVRINVIRSTDVVRVEVHEPPIRTDRGHYDDVPAHSEDVIESIADRWGVDDRSTGRIVWFELDARPSVEFEREDAGPQLGPLRAHPREPSVEMTREPARHER